MAPIDTTPHGGEIMQPPERPFPEPKPAQESDGFVRGSQVADEAADEPDIGHRPALPEHPERMAVDIEDEEADPVIESGPGIDDGLKELGEAARLSNMDPEVPSPEPVPPFINPDPQPNDPKPKAPPAEDEPGRRPVPVELPGKPGMPERA